MAESQLPKAESIFQAIADLPPEQRESVLAEQCGNDAELRALVVHLLAKHDREMDSFPERLPLGSTVPSEPRHPHPKRIGHYEILRKIGEGGMGTVYEARQESPHRTVAVKVVRQDLTGASLWKRFQFEAQILGQLNHRGIAQVYEAGTADDGTPFFAMEYVRGLPLLEYAEQHRLDSRQRLALMARTCEAVHHAHEKGVIHRDLKPGNILVTESENGSPQPKILDFGVARAVHSALQPASLHTRTGQLLGTLAYMSPEQVGGHPEELDERSDVYQLGVILYELLAGKRPYELEDVPITEAARIIQEREAPSVSSLDTSLRGDVEIIVAKALEKERDRRYASAAALAEDIRHCLTDEPIVARPASAFYRVRKLARRNRAALITGVIGIAVAATAVGIALRTERPSEVDPSAMEDAGPSVALVDVRDLSNLEDPMPGAIMTNLLEVGLIEASPCRVVSLEYLKDLRRRMFESVVGPIEPGQALEVARVAGATSLLLCDLTETDGLRSLMWRLVDTASGEALGARRIEGGEFADLADSAVAGVLPLLAEAAGTEGGPSASVRDATTGSPDAYRHFTAAMLALEDGRRADATRELEKAIEIDSTFALAHMELSMNGAIPYGRMVEAAETAWTLRDQLGLKDRLRLEAEVADRTDRLPLEESINTYREILRRWPDDLQAILDLLRKLYENWQDPEEIRTLAEHGIVLYPDNEQMFWLFATSLRLTGRIEESTTAIRDRLRSIPGETSRAELKADLTWEIGRNFVALGAPDSAEACFRRAADLDPTNFPAGPGTAMCSYMRGDVEEAIRTRESNLEDPNIPPHGRSTSIIQTSSDPGIAQLHAEIGRIEKAFELMKEAEKLYPDPGHTVEVHRNWLRLRTNRAADVLESVSSGALKAVGRRPMMRAKALAALDSLEAAKGVVDSLLSFPGASDFWSARAWGYFYVQEARAEVALAQGHPEEVLEFLESKGIRWRGRTMRDVDRLERLSRAYRMMGRHDDAEATLRELLAFYGGHAVGHYKLGKLLEEGGRAEEADAEYERFLEMWSDADEGLPQLVDARQRFASLRARSTQ